MMKEELMPTNYRRPRVGGNESGDVVRVVSIESGGCRERWVSRVVGTESGGY